MKTDPRALQMLADKAAAHYQAGRFSSAEKFYLRALKGAPKHPQLLFALAAIYEELAAPKKALKFYSRALEADPHYVDARLNYGACLQGIGRFAEAEAAFRRLIDHEPEFLLAHYNLGTILADQARHGDAVIAFERTLEIDPRMPDAWFNMANALRDSERLSEAIVSYEKAIGLRPDFASALVNLGVVQQTLGAFDTARKNFMRALDINPDLPAAHYQLSLMGDGNGGIDKGIAQIEEILENLDALDPGRATLHFAAARLNAKNLEHDHAFAHFDCANIIRASSHPFDIESFDDKINSLIVAYTREIFDAEADFLNTDSRPVFIVGMPRSGTTLVEQIIASHPDVYGAGERSEIVRFVGENFDHGSPTRFDARAVQKFAADYILAISRDAGDALRITDKMPGNFLNLGLIVRMFPNATIIHCKRDPLDTCLSCYFQNFAEILPFTNDLKALGSYYLAYRRLMDHWRSVLPVKIHEIAYEELVHNTEANSRALIAHLDLDWDPACLEFFKTERPVTTASMWQARQPVYTGSVGAWRNYDRHLGALKDSLRINTSLQGSGSQA